MLIELDRLHDDDSPCLDASGFPGDRAVLLVVALSAIGQLNQHGVDPLSVELVLARLADAYGLDGA